MQIAAECFAQQFGGTMDGRMFLFSCVRGLHDRRHARFFIAHACVIWDVFGDFLDVRVVGQRQKLIKVNQLVASHELGAVGMA